MHDTHCHLDLYPDPYEVAIATEQSGITTIAVTNLPSAYYAAKPHMSSFHHLKLAIGLHPLAALKHTPQEKESFQRAFSETQYVGEVGLDFSKQGISTKERQLDSFRFVLELLQHESKFVTLHSRRAESTVLDLLTSFGVGPTVFHWYSGSLTVLDKIINAGHYLSINTAMIHSKNGQRIINRIPKHRLLTETDGPFIKVQGKAAMPANVEFIHRYLAEVWGASEKAVEAQAEENLIQCLELSVTS